MLFENVTMLDENFDVKQHMFIGIRDGKFAYIGEKMPEDVERYGMRRSDTQGKVFLPAFYNAHSHMGMYLLRGYGENLRLNEWLNDRIFPAEACLTRDAVYYATMASVAEMLRFGIVGTSDMYMYGDGMCQAILDSGMKGNMSVSVTNFTDAPYQELPQYAETMGLLKKFHGKNHGKLKVEFSIHAEYTSNESTVRELVKTAKANNSSLHIHISETEAEVKACRERHKGLSPVQYFEQAGAFELPTMAAHCVHVDETDRKILAANHVNVASCPKSNLKLGSGIAPTAQMILDGINVAIGTDSVASNNNLNMMEEIRFFSLLQKGIHGDPTLITEKQALYAATRAGALAQGRRDCGLIKEGFKADMIALDKEKIYMQPEHSLLSNLVYSASGNDICMTMADGEILYEDQSYKKMDISSILEKEETERLRILEEVKNNKK